MTYVREPDDVPAECTACGAISGGMVRDPDTGETVEAWWCVACGFDKTVRSAPRGRNCS